MKLPELNLPRYDFRFEENGKHEQIFDPVRKKYVALTPEEWVRQNFIQYMIQGLGYPKGLMQVEATVHIYNLTRRCDIVLFTRTAEPQVIVECKAPTVPISEETFEQIAVYNGVLKAQYLFVTNGLAHYCCRINYDAQTYDFLSSVPTFQEL